MAVTVRLAPGKRPALREIAALVQAVEMYPWTTDPGWQAWSSRAVAVERSFRRARVERERALLDALCDPSGHRHLLQPGLFDRRAERAHLSDATRQLEAETAVRASLAAAERGCVTTSCPRAVLVLIP
jgi:hypothetical protein